MAGLRRPGRRTLVRRWGRTGVVPLLLGSGALPTPVCPSASGTRNPAGPVAAGQSGGARGVAASASVDRARTVLREKPTRLERRFLQQPALHLGVGTAGGRSCDITSASAVGATTRSFATGKLDALSTAAGTGRGNRDPAFTRTNKNPAESSMKSAFHTLAFVTPSFNHRRLTNSLRHCQSQSVELVGNNYHPH